MLVAKTHRPLPEYVMLVLVAEYIDCETDEILARALGGTMSLSALSRSYNVSSIVASRSDESEISESVSLQSFNRS